MRTRLPASTLAVALYALFAGSALATPGALVQLDGTD